MVWVLRGDRDDLKLCVVALFSLGGRHVADGLEKPAIVEPVDPFERGKLHRLIAAPAAAPVDDLGFVEAIIVSARALS